MTVQSPVLAGIQERIREWPTKPGVYLMRDTQNRILYVGKAKSLRARIKSYFLRPDALEGRTRALIKRVADVEFQVTSTELEALLLECNLIKKHRPRYNIRLKDDKNFPYVALDFSHPFPVFRITRKVSSHGNTKYFGPFSVGVNDIGRFLLKTFQLRDCSEAKFKNRKRPCLNYEIGTCTAPCVGYVTEEQYAAQVREAILFLGGKKQELLRTLKAEMEDAAEKLQFERAKTIRDKINSIRKLTEKQNAVLSDRGKDVDVVGTYTQMDQMQWVILFIRAGILTGRKAVKITVPLGNFDEARRTFLEQFYLDAILPNEIWMMDDFPDRSTLETLFTEKAGRNVKVAVKRGETPMRLLGMAAENARLVYEENKNKTATSASAELASVLSLSEPPHTIEGIDVSNFQGKLPSVALVHFADERPLKTQYRTYHPKTVEGQDDFAMIHEIVMRRYSNPDNARPDLLLIDGGKGQLGAAMRALSDLQIEIPLVALAKGRTESGFTRKEIQKTEERLFVPGRMNPIVLREGNPALALLQRVRDEAHRFSVKMHRVRRKNEALKSGDLLDIKGVGEKTRIKLLKKYGSVEAAKAALLREE